MNNQEARLQYECVKWFRETYPDHKDDIVMIHNETDKGAYYMSLGMVPGASDLMVFNRDKTLFVELKVEGSYHDLKKLRNQLRFVERRQDGSAKHGGCFLSSFDRFKEFTSYFMENGNLWKGKCRFTIIAMKQMIEKAKEKGNKTAKIELEKHYE